MQGLFKKITRQTVICCCDVRGVKCEVCFLGLGYVRLTLISHFPHPTSHFSYKLQFDIVNNPNILYNTNKGANVMVELLSPKDKCKSEIAYIAIYFPL